MPSLWCGLSGCNCRLESLHHKAGAGTEESTAKARRREGRREEERRNVGYNESVRRFLHILLNAATVLSLAGVVGAMILLWRGDGDQLLFDLPLGGGNRLWITGSRTEVVGRERRRSQEEMEALLHSRGWRAENDETVNSHYRIWYFRMPHGAALFVFGALPAVWLLRNAWRNPTRVDGKCSK